MQYCYFCRKRKVGRHSISLIKIKKQQMLNIFILKIKSSSNQACTGIKKPKLKQSAQMVILFNFYLESELSVMTCVYHVNQWNQCRIYLNSPFSFLSFWRERFQHSYRFGKSRSFNSIFLKTISSWLVFNRLLTTLKLFFKFRPPCLTPEFRMSMQFHGLLQNLHTVHVYLFMLAVFYLGLFITVARNLLYFKMNKISLNLKPYHTLDASYFFSSHILFLFTSSWHESRLLQIAM